MSAKIIPAKINSLKVVNMAGTQEIKLQKNVLLLTNALFTNPLTLRYRFVVEKSVHTSILTIMNNC